jgi:hypothetical protein
MSTPGPQPDPAPDSAALFDELDALLQRMLALPVDPATREDRPLPEDLPPLLTVAEAALDPLPPAALAPLGMPGTEHPPADERPAAPVREPTAPSAVRGQPAPEPTVLPPVPPAWRRLLVRVNDAFDDWAFARGAPTRWLTGRFGRALLGVAGLGLLALVGALVLRDRFGWTW